MNETTTATTTTDNIHARAFFKDTLKEQDALDNGFRRRMFGKYIANNVKMGVFTVTDDDITDVVKALARRDNIGKSAEDVRDGVIEIFGDELVRTPTTNDIEQIINKVVTFTLPAGEERYIHVDRNTIGQKIVREANQRNEYGYFCKSVKILGESEFITLDTALNNGTLHVIKTSAELVLTIEEDQTQEKQYISARC